ncbi:uncharacterized protein tcf23 [Spinachia spinachia]
MKSELRSSGESATNMALNPLEGLMAVAANHQLVPEPQRLKVPRPPPRGHRLSPGSSREPRKWVQSVCASRSASACESVVQCSTLRGQHSPENAARERSRVRNLRQAFHSLQAALPSVPPDTKLSKLDVLVLAANYIAHLTETLDQGATLAEHTLPPPRPGGYLHPVKKWPMRSLLYCGSVGELLSGVQVNQMAPPGREVTRALTPPLEAERE